jgi:hypothetical protein
VVILEALLRSKGCFGCTLTACCETANYGSSKLYGLLKTFVDAAKKCPWYAMQLYLHMCEQGVQPDAVTCCSLINAMDKADKWQLAEKIFLSIFRFVPFVEALSAVGPPETGHMDESELLLVRELCFKLSSACTRHNGIPTTVASGAHFHISGCIPFGITQ